MNTYYFLQELAVGQLNSLGLKGETTKNNEGGFKKYKEQFGDIRTVDYLVGAAVNVVPNKYCFVYFIKYLSNFVHRKGDNKI